MDTYLKILTMVLCGCAAGLFLTGSPLRWTVSLCCAVLCGILLCETIPVVTELLDRLIDVAGVSDTLVVPLLKAVGIGVLSQIGCGYCCDLGEKALGGMLEQGAIVAIVVVSLPLFSAVLDVLTRLMEG